MTISTAVLAEVMEPRLFDLDFQLLADTCLTIIAVFVLFLALSYFFFNPARKFMQARQDRIAGELEHAKSKEEEAARLKEEYEAKLANETRIVAAAKEEASRIIARANAEAELEKKKVADEVKQEMISLAAAMAGKIAAVSMDEEKQNALIEETLSEIGESTWLS